MIVAANVAAILLGVAAFVTACGGVLSTILSARRARSEERVICEEQLRAIRLEAGDLADQLYRLKTHKETT